VSEGTEKKDLELEEKDAAEIKGGVVRDVTNPNMTQPGVTKPGTTKPGITRDVH
jgi:hypothetical protein